MCQHIDFGPYSNFLITEQYFTDILVEKLDRIVENVPQRCAIVSLIGN